jgi:ABC-type nitrate/sulfonate/bicarbonate transport system substrate-binding protein
MKVGRFMIRVLSCLALLLAASPEPSAQERITLGITTKTGSTGLPFMIAEEKGFFKSEGLDAVSVVMQNQVVVNGVVARQVDYGGTFSNFVGTALSGLPVRIVMAVMDGSDHYLVTAPNLKRVEDLKGKNSVSAASAAPLIAKRS